MQNKILNHMFWNPLFYCKTGFHVWPSHQSALTDLPAEVILRHLSVSSIPAAPLFDFNVIAMRV